MLTNVGFLVFFFTSFTAFSWSLAQEYSDYPILYDTVDPEPYQEKFAFTNEPPEFSYGDPWYAQDTPFDPSPQPAEGPSVDQRNGRPGEPTPQETPQRPRKNNVVQEAPKKREGQEEFLTFVDPIAPKPSHLKIQPKLSLASLSIEKRVSNVGLGTVDASNTFFIVLVTGCAAVGVLGVALGGVMFTRLHRRYKAAQETEYPQYGVTGPARERVTPLSPVASMDAKLASSAQLYHYQHTKQQILATDGISGGTRGHESDESDGEGDEGDFSVYECPGLAPTGDLEISNPLFESQNPSGSPVTKTSAQQLPTLGNSRDSSSRDPPN